MGKNGVGLGRKDGYISRFTFSDGLQIGHQHECHPNAGREG